MYCPLCAVELGHGQTRCASCGAPVTTEPKPETAVPPHRPAPEWTPPPPTAPPDPLLFPPIGPVSGMSTEPPPWVGGVDSSAPAAAQRSQRGLWRAAAVCAGLPIATVYAAGLLLTLLYAAVAGGLPGSAFVTMPAGAVATSFGAEWALTLGGRDFGDIFGTGPNLTYHVRAYPLLLSVLGVVVLAGLVRRRFAAGVAAATLTDRLTQAARIGLLLGAGCLVLALISRQAIGTGHVNAEYPLAFLAGTVVGGLTVAAVAVWHDPTQAPPTLARFGGALAEPLVALRFAIPVIVLVSIVQLLGVLLFGPVNDDLTAMGLDTGSSRSLGVALLVPFAPNAAWMLFGVVVGAPLNLHSGISVGAGHPTSLVDLAGGSAWWWLAPVVTFGVLFAAGALLALRSPDAQVARHRIGVWSLVFGVASFGLSSLGMVALRLRGPFGDLHASVGNGPALVLALSCAWALLSGLAAVSVVSRLTPAARARWAARVRPQAEGRPGPAVDGTDGAGPGRAPRPAV